MAKNIKPEIRLLVDILDQAYNKRAWHGTNLMGSIRGLTIKQLLWKPSPKSHNIWEIIMHTAYWKYIVHRQLTGSEKGTFPRSPSDWSRLPDQPDLKAWQADLRLVKKYHKLLREAILDFPASRLEKTKPKSKVKFKQIIYGVSSHDLYHAGQVQLIKRLHQFAGQTRAD
jgi:hypothetical protein